MAAEAEILAEFLFVRADDDLQADMAGLVRRLLEAVSQ